MRRGKCVGNKMSEPKGRPKAIILYDGIPDSGLNEGLGAAGYEVVLVTYDHPEFVEVPDQTTKKRVTEEFRSGLQEILQDGRQYPAILFDIDSGDSTYDRAEQVTVIKEVLGQDVKIIATNIAECFMDPETVLFYLAMGFEAVVIGPDISQLVKAGYAAPQSFEEDPGPSKSNRYVAATDKLKKALQGSYHKEIVKTLDTTLGL